MVQQLLQAARAAASVAAADDSLPLHLAAEHGHAAVVRLLLEAAPAASTALSGDGRTPLRTALAAGQLAAARALCAGPAAAALAALATAGQAALPLFTDFLLAPGRLPLCSFAWELVPSPCPGVGRALPAAFACSPAQAAQVVRRLPPADKARLRAAALLLSLGCQLPFDVVARIVAHLFAS